MTRARRSTPYALLAIGLLSPACSSQERATAAPPVPVEAPAASEAAPPNGGFSPERVQSMVQLLRSRVTAGRIPGGVLLVARNGQVVVEEALGKRDPKTGAAMQRDSIFRIYSMSKPIVSAGVMMLVEEGRVLLNDPISKYFPELRELKVGVEKPGPKGEPVLELEPMQREMTIQDLLRHTSGLTYGVFGKSLVKSEYLKHGVDAHDITNQELITRLAQVPLQFQPGTTWEYSRSTDVLGALIERVSGQTLDVYLAERIFEPLQMPDTGFWVEQLKHGRIAEPFAEDPDTKQPVAINDVRSKPSLLSGGGGLVSTARDYLRFCQAMLDGGELDGARILSPHTVRYMTSDHLGAIRGPRYAPGPGYGFGLGFAVRTATGEAASIGNAGELTWGGWAGTAFWIDPREKLIAIWMMQAPGQRDEVRGMLRNLVYGALTDAETPVATKL